MKNFLFLSFILLSSSFYQCLSETCGGLNCGAGPCCLDSQNGPFCYSTSSYSCVQHSAGYRLCGAGEGVCGPSSQTYCYNTNQYNCVGGQLQQKPASSTSAKASTSSSSSSSTTGKTTTGSTTGKSTTTGSSGGGCGTNNANCGSMSCCLAPSGTGMCYQPTAYTCTEGTLCPPGYAGCGQACYHPTQYSCVNGQLQQTGSAGSTTSSSTTGKPATTSSSTTGTPATTGGSTTGGNRVAVKLWGINYSPKRPSGACPTLAEVEADLRVLETLTYRIRIYSVVDCNAGYLILQALKNTNVNLRLTLGLWLDQYHYAEFPNELASLKSLLDSGVRLDKVDDYIVGSETQYRNNFDWSILVGYMQNISATLTSYGYSNIDVVTSDVIYNLIGSPILNYENVVYVNQFPFWEGAHVNDGRQLLATTVNNLRGAIGNSKPIIIGETGWPTGGDNFGSSVPGSSNLNTYLEHVVCYLNQQQIGYFWFSAFDEPFREDKHGGVERYFGIRNSDRSAKAGVQVPVMCPV